MNPVINTPAIQGSRRLSSRGDTHKRMQPRTTFTEASKTWLFAVPIMGSSRNPASTLPVIPPVVFTAYTQPVSLPADSSAAIQHRTATGNCHPKKAAIGKIRIKLIRSLPKKLKSPLGPRTLQKPEKPASLLQSKILSEISNFPKVDTGRAEEKANRVENQLPMAMPQKSSQHETKSIDAGF